MTPDERARLNKRIDNMLDRLTALGDEQHPADPDPIREIQMEAIREELSRIAARLYQWED